MFVKGLASHTKLLRIPISDLNQEDMHKPTTIIHKCIDDRDADSGMQGSRSTEYVEYWCLELLNKTESIAHATISEPTSAVCVDKCCVNACMNNAKETITTRLSIGTNQLIASINLDTLRF